MCSIRMMFATKPVIQAIDSIIDDAVAAVQWLNYSTEGGGSLFCGETATRLEICIGVYQLLGPFYACIRIILHSLK